jgi:hypothetical protein
MDLLSPRAIGVAHHSPPAYFTADEGLPSSDGHGIAGVRFEFTVESHSRRSRLVAAFLRVRFDTGEVRPDDLWLAPGTPGSVMVLTDGSPGWLFGDPRQGTPIAATNSAYVLLEVPAGLEVLTGTIRLDATRTLSDLARTRREHASSAAALPFSVGFPAGWSAVTRPRRALPAPAQPDSPLAGHPSVRLCVAADIEKFSRFHAPEAARAQRRFLDLLAAARQHAGITEPDVVLQKAGDGQFAVLPPGIDESVVVPKLVEGLREALRSTNADLNERARLRLRVAFHRGHVTPGVNGWVGVAAIAVHRLLDLDALRQALTDAPHADLALIIPDLLYREIVAPGYGTLTPDRFTAIDAAVPAKNFTERAWIHTVA